MTPLGISPEQWLMSTACLALGLDGMWAIDRLLQRLGRWA